MGIIDNAYNSDDSQDSFDLVPDPERHVINYSDHPVNILEDYPPYWTKNVISFMPQVYQGLHRTGPMLPDGFDTNSSPYQYIRLFFPDQMIQEFVN